MGGVRRDAERSRGLGAWGEQAAAEFLARRGLAICARNWRDGRRGEIDIVAREGSTLVFVEVKTRRGRARGSALESVDARKLRRLRRLAGRWLARNRPGCPARIDVVGVTLDGRQCARVEWLAGVG